ncbi:unnamed protein product, partial [marine sediment metagenome]
NPKEAADYYHKLYTKPLLDQENAVTTQQNQIQQAQETTVNSVQEFSKSEAVVKVLTEKPELGDAFGKFIKSEIQPPKGGYTVKDLERAWNWFRHEDVISETKEDTKRETIQQLNDANPDVITLTNAKDSKATGSNLKKMSREQAAEHGASISEEELNKLIDSRIG